MSIFSALASATSPTTLRRRALAFSAVGVLTIGGLLAGCNNNGGGSSNGGSETASPAPAASASTEAAASPGASPAAAASGTTAAPSAKKIRLAFVTNNSSQYWTMAQAGVNKAKSELGDNATIDFVVPAEGTAADQKSKVDDLLAKGVDGVAISPVDPDNQTEMLNGIADKAALVTQDSDAPASKRLCYIGSDNVEAGKLEGQLIKEALPNGGKIMLFVGKKDARNAQDRAKGIIDTLKGSNITIIDTKTDDTDHTKAKTNAADTLVKYPDIAGLVGLWSYNGPAIDSAVKDAGKVGKVKIICFDDEDGTLAGIKDGSIYATVVQQPFEIGYQSMVDLSKYLNGDKSVFPANQMNIIPVKAVKQADVAAYKANLDTLLGKK